MVSRLSLIATPAPVRAAAAVAGLLADRALGEPPMSWHPVAAFGQMMGAVERRWWRDRRWAGTGYALAGAGTGFAAGATMSTGGAPRRFAAGAAATYVAVAGRALRDEALGVQSALDRGQVEEARVRCRSLVGRRTDDLDASEVARAAVESVAENTVDAVVAPALWAALAGAPGVLAYRAINTLDAMVGHRSSRYERFGWASARADDLAGWLPARLTAALVAAVRPRRGRAIWQAVRHHAPRHPSPNAGVAEAAFAAALGVRLGGPSEYDGRVEQRPLLGWGTPPGTSHICDACRLSRDVSGALIVALALVGSAWACARPWPSRSRR